MVLKCRIGDVPPRTTQPATGPSRSHDRRGPIAPQVSSPPPIPDDPWPDRSPAVLDPCVPIDRPLRTQRPTPTYPSPDPYVPIARSLPTHRPIPTYPSTDPYLPIDDPYVPNARPLPTHRPTPTYPSTDPYLPIDRPLLTHRPTPAYPSTDPCVPIHGPPIIKLHTSDKRHTPPPPPHPNGIDLAVRTSTSVDLAGKITVGDFEPTDRATMAILIHLASPHPPT